MKPRKTCKTCGVRINIWKRKSKRVYCSQNCSDQYRKNGKIEGIVEQMKKLKKIKKPHLPKETVVELGRLNVIAERQRLMKEYGLNLPLL